MKPSPERLLLPSYALNDADRSPLRRHGFLQHLNNVALAGIYEEARLRRCIGTADTVIVWTAGGRPHPLPDHFRTALEARADRPTRIYRSLKEPVPCAKP